MLNKEVLETYILSLGVDLVGFSNADFDTSLYWDRVFKKEKNHTLYPRHFNVSDYIDIKKHVKEAKLIISIGLSYQNKTIRTAEKYAGYYSKITYGRDYHQVVYPLLEKIITFLQSFKIDLSYYICCDTKALDDKFFAYLCGNGAYGKNSMIINQEYGSEVVYGTIVCDLDVDVTTNLINDLCLECNRCELACPSQSIGEYNLNYSTCLAHLTQAKEMIDYRLMDNYLYGCDRCVNVCPYNTKKQNNHFKEEVGYINLLELFELSNREYQTRYGDKSMSWLNKNILKKNAIMLLKRYVENGDEVIIDYLQQYQKKNKSLLLEEALKYCFEE